MSTTTIKNLGIGSLTTIPTALYWVPVSTSAIVKTITFVNQTSLAAQLNVSISSGTSSAYILPPTYSLEGQGMLSYDTPNITLGPRDAISGWSDTVSAIQFVINGVEQA